MSSEETEQNYVTPQLYIMNQENKYPASKAYLEGAGYGPISQFEVTTKKSNRSGKVGMLTDKLNKGWFFLFKCFVFLVFSLDVAGVGYELISILSKKFFNAPSGLIIIALLAFQANQMLVLFKAMHYLDREKAERAVKLITYFMIIFALGVVGLIPLLVHQSGTVETENFSILKMVGIILATVGIFELVIYWAFLYGAKKVAEILKEIALLQGSQFITA